MRYKTYEDYLTSDKWQMIKKEFRANKYCDDTCFLCYYKGPKVVCHHWRYPKNWNNDSPENLILLCTDCHDTVHDLKISDMLHSSYQYESNELHRYLSHLVKALNLMELKKFERLANLF